MANDSIGVVLQFLLDKNANKATEGGIKDLERAMSGLDDESLHLAATLVDKTNAALDAAQKKFRQTAQEARELKKISAGIGNASRAMFMAGAAVVGSVFLAANKEAKRLEQSGVALDATTQKWLNANKSIEASMQSVGRTAMTAALPVLEKAATLAEKAAKYIEKNPDLVKAVLNAGIAVAAVGAIGMAVSKGIRLYADIMWLTAFAQFNASSVAIRKAGVDILTGALLMKKGGTLGVPAITPQAGMMGKLGTVTLMAGSVILGANVGFAIGNAILKATGQKEQTWGDVGVTTSKLILSPIALLNKGLYDLGLSTNQAYTDVVNFNNGILQFVKSAIDGTDAIDEMSTATQNLISASDMQQATRMMMDYRREEAELLKRAGDERVSITKQAADNEERIMERMWSDIEKVSSAAAKQIKSVTETFNLDARRSEQDYYIDRATAIRDGGEEIAQIERDAQERLRKLRMEHEDRLEDLVGRRDALGIVQENRNYERQRAEVDRETNQEIAQRRRDIAIRLRDMAQAYALERQRRLEDFQLRIAEIQAQEQEQIAAIRATNAAEIAENKAAMAEKLRLLDQELAMERQRKYQAFVAALRDLNANLIGEQELKNRYYTMMQQDLERFLQQYRSGILPQVQIPGYAAGGYAGPGIIRIEDGQREFVMNSRTTRTAEQLIGGKLNQQNVLGLGKNVTLNLQLSNGMNIMQLKREIRNNNKAIFGQLSEMVEAI